jgi:hypothetical protein
MDKRKKSQKKKRKLAFLKNSKDSNIQSRHVVAPKEYRKKKYMRDPYYDTKPVTYYPDKKINIK